MKKLFMILVCVGVMVGVAQGLYNVFGHIVGREPPESSWDGKSTQVGGIVQNRLTGEIERIAMFDGDYCGKGSRWFMENDGLTKQEFNKLYIMYEDMEKENP